MQSPFTKSHSQDFWRKSPECGFTPAGYHYSQPYPRVLPPKSRKLCKYNSECQYISTGCRFSHPSLNVLPQKSVKLCWFGSRCWYIYDGCPFSHPPANVPLTESEYLQTDRNQRYFGWVSNGVTTHDILNFGVSYDGHPISKKRMQEVMKFINSRDLTALIETHPTVHWSKVVDGMFLTVSRIRNSDQASNQKELLSLFEEIKGKFEFKWSPKLPISSKLQISFGSVNEFYNQVKRDYQAIQLCDYWKEQDQEDWNNYNKEIQALNQGK